MPLNPIAPVGDSRDIETADREGKIGVLKEVRCYEDRPGRVYLSVDHDGTTYVGCLLLDDQKFCKHAFEHLRRCYGMAIQAVGTSELPYE